MLELPKTIRVPKPGEMRHRTDLQELLMKRNEAQIVPGYELKENRTPQLPFAFSAAINVNHSKLWSLFLALADTFPDQVNAVFGIYEKNTVTTAKFSKEKVMKAFETFKTELTHDGSLIFGLLYHTKDALLELTVTESKYIRYSGNNQQAFEKIMKDFNLLPKRRLEFIDEYPKIVEPLNKFIATAKKPEEVILGLNKILGVPH